jgi:hypothetical protein
MITSEKGTFKVVNVSGNISIQVVDRDKLGAKISKATSNIKILDKSIEKWQFIVDILDLGLVINCDGGRFTCALCLKYAMNGAYGCNGCPIYAETGARGCVGTPYDDFHKKREVESQIKLALDEVRFLTRLKEEALGEVFE